VERRELFEPGVLVRCEYTKRVSCLGEHLAALKDHLVLVPMKHDAGMGQFAQHMGIAGVGGRLVIVVGKYGLHLDLLGQRGDGGGGRSMENDQPDTAGALGIAQRLQVQIKLHQGFPDELHPPVPAQAALQQGFENVGVKDEHAPHLAADLERVVERGIVFGAQIAAKPHQALVVGVHGGGVWNSGVRVAA
jgi:hypothetical protein